MQTKLPLRGGAWGRIAKMIYTVYAEHDDMTFIMKEEDNTLEVTGFYFGPPDAAATEKFNGELKAHFEPETL